MLHLVLTSLEKYIALKHSFIHWTMVTKARVLGSSFLVWIAKLFVTVPLAITDVGIYLKVNNSILLYCTVVIVFCQVTVNFEARHHEKQIASQQVSTEARKKFSMEKKSLKTTTTTLLALLISYSPLLYG